jgi:hypothetical protein
MKLTTSGRGKLTTDFAGEDFKSSCIIGSLNKYTF